MAAKQTRGAETTRRILDAALAVHRKGGHAGFTVHAVAAESGASLGSLYHHFKSIDGVAAELYAECMAHLLDELAAALARSRTAHTGVVAFVRAYLEFAQRHPDEARFIHGAPSGGFLASHGARIAEAKAARMEPILAWLRKHVAAGEIADVPEPLFEMLVVGPVAELTRRWLAGAPGLDLAEAARVLPEPIWRSVRREGR
jgi:AcrR family transcriptional regulator